MQKPTFWPVAQELLCQSWIPSLPPSVLWATSLQSTTFSVAYSYSTHHLLERTDNDCQGSWRLAQHSWSHHLLQGDCTGIDLWTLRKGCGLLVKILLCDLLSWLCHTWRSKVSWRTGHTWKKNHRGWNSCATSSAIVRMCTSASLQLKSAWAESWAKFHWIGACSLV